MVCEKVILVLALIICFINPVASQFANNYRTEHLFPRQDLSGNQIAKGVREAFNNQSMSTTNHGPAMRPGVTGSIVRKPQGNIIQLGPSSVAGNWSLKLMNPVKYLNLTFYQSEDAVFGYGNLTDNGTIEHLTAGGTVVGDELGMYIIPIVSQNLYRMWLKLQPGYMEGDYILSGPGVLRHGSLTGILIQPQHTVVI